MIGLNSPRNVLGPLLAVALAGSLPGLAAAQDETAAPVTPGGTLPGEPSIELVRVADGLADPVNITSDGSGRLFVTERIGRIRIIDADGTLLEEPFLDVQDAVKTDFLEQGLLGLAFPPDYQESGQFYTYHSDYGTNGNLRITRYQVSEDDANVADPESGMLILEIPDDPNVNHNGGNLEFGPDGYLYWSTGDGGAAGDPYENAQNIRTLYGILGRIDVSESTELEPYAIPEDNPFALSSRIPTGDPADFHPGAMPEIWAYGLRNPWQFSFDAETGDLYIADVGQNAWEEIDFAAAGTPGGQNYGWDWLEGSHCYPASMETCPRQQVGVLPVAEYPHSDGDCSITGLGVHRGEGSAELAGTYFVADYCSGRVWGLARDDSDEWVLQQLLDTTLLVAGGGTSAAGDVYLTACSCSFGRDYDPLADPSGTVWRIVSAGEVPSDAVTAPLEGEAQAPNDEESPQPAEEPSPEASPSAAADGTAEPTDGSTASPAPDQTSEPTEEATEPPSSPDASAEATVAPSESPSAQPSAEPTRSPDGDSGGDEAVARQLQAKDIAFSKDSLSVPAGANVELTFTNADSVQHSVSIYESEAAKDLIFEGEVFAGPDASRTYEFQAPSEPGTYFFRCEVHPQQMTGVLKVN